jgi:hypothetical protein
MLVVPIRPEYGPTLGRLLSPRWRAASRAARGAVILALGGVLGLMVAAALTLENAEFSRGGKVPFSFAYRGLYTVPADPGGYVRVARRRAGDGRLEDSFAVEPLTLPPYAGELSGELPLYAAAYIHALAARYADFTLYGDGKSSVNGVPAYNVYYTARVEGHLMWGRDFLLMPERRGAREGVDIVMLTSPTANARVTSPYEVAFTGILMRPLKSFSFG